TTLALLIGLLVANVVQPGVRDGHGIATIANDANTESNTDAANGSPPAQKSSADQVAKFQTEAHKRTFVDHLLNIIPVTIVGAFAEGNLLQILFFAVLFGLAVSTLGLGDSPVMAMMEQLTEIMFRVVAMIMKVAPLGALGAMAYTVSKFGIEALLP